MLLAHEHQRALDSQETVAITNKEHFKSENISLLANQTNNDELGGKRQADRFCEAQPPSLDSQETQEANADKNVVQEDGEADERPSAEELELLKCRLFGFMLRNIGDDVNERYGGEK